MYEHLKRWRWYKLKKLTIRDILTSLLSSHVHMTSDYEKPMKVTFNLVAYVLHYFDVENISH